LDREDLISFCVIFPVCLGLSFQPGKFLRGYESDFPFGFFSGQDSVFSLPFVTILLHFLFQIIFTRIEVISLPEYENSVRFSAHIFT